MGNKTVTLTPDMAAYPDEIRQRLASASPFMVQGQWPIPDTPSLALLSSAKAPASILLAVHDLAQRWRYGAQTIISGFHSPVEQEAFEILLRGPGQVIYCPARCLPKHLKPAWRTALEAGHLTILSPFPNTIRRATKETAIYRNRIITALADEVLIAYAHPGSSTERLTQEVLGWGKPVYTLPYDCNAHLQAMGATPWQPEVN